MQFYLNGYTPGDPDILPAAPGAEKRSAELPDAVDVLIVGSGPAGHAAGGPALDLSRHQHPPRRASRRPAPGRPGRWRRVPHGRDVRGFRPERRSWSAKPTGSTRPSSGARRRQDRSRIVRTGRVQDTEDGLSEFPHVIVNQARMQQYLLDYMRKSPTRLEPDYGLEFVTLEVDSEGDYPVVVTLRNVDERRGDDDPRQVRRRLRRCAQPGARFDRRRAARRLRQPRLGRRGHAGRHRLPGHPAQGRDPVGGRGQHPAHPARGRLHGAAVRRPR